MPTTQNDTKLSEGTALILLRESSTNEEFREYLNALGMSYTEAFVKMNKGREKNIQTFSPHRPILTLRKAG